MISFVIHNTLIGFSLCGETYPIIDLKTHYQGQQRSAQWRSVRSRRRNERYAAGGGGFPPPQHALGAVGATRCESR